MTTLSEHIKEMMELLNFSSNRLASAVLYLLERAEREDKAVDAKYGMHVDGNNDEYMKVLKMAEDSGVADDIRRKEAPPCIRTDGSCELPCRVASEAARKGAIQALEWVLEHAVTDYSTCVRNAIERLKKGGTL